MGDKKIFYFFHFTFRFFQKKKKIVNFLKIVYITKNILEHINQMMNQYLGVEIV